MQEHAVHIVLVCVDVARLLRQRSSFLSRELDDASDVIELLSGTVVDLKHSAKLEQEVVNLLQLLCQHLIEHLDIRKPAKLLDQVSLKPDEIIKCSILIHPVPPLPLRHW